MNSNDYNKLDDQLRNLDLSYNNIDVSYIIRNHLVSIIRKKNNKGNSEILLNKNILFRFLKSFIATFPAIFRRKKIWVFSNTERRKKINNIYYDRVASVVSEVYNSVLFVENPVLVAHKSSTTDFILSDSIFFLISFLLGKVFYKKKNLIIDKQLDQIIKPYDITPNIKPLIERFIGQYYFMRFYLKYIAKPEKVFSVYPNGYYGYNFAFKELGIPIIELQHGIIYPLHPSYNSTLQDQSKNFKPDYVFTYGTKDKECLDTINYVAKENIFVVGSYGLWKLNNTKIYLSSYLASFSKSGYKKLIIIATTNDVEELYRLALCYKIADFVLTKSSTGALESLFMKIPTFILESEKSFFRDNYAYVESFNYIKSAREISSNIINRDYKEPSTNDIEKIYALDVIDNFSNSLKQI